MNQVDEEEFDPALQDDERDAGLTPQRRESDGEPDVLLDVPELRVDEISLEVEDLRARVALQADVFSLLKLHVGVEAELGRVQLTIKGVEAQALLKVRLDNVARIIDRVLTTIDNNPDIVEGLIEQVGEAAEEVGAGAGQALGELAPGAGSAVEEAGKAAGTAVGGVGRDVEDGFQGGRARRRAARGRGRRGAASEATEGPQATAIHGESSGGPRPPKQGRLGGEEAPYEGLPHPRLTADRRGADAELPGIRGGRRDHRKRSRRRSFALTLSPTVTVRFPGSKEVDCE